MAGVENPPGKVRSTFSGITLDGVAKTPVLDATDRATVSINGNSATIIVDSTLPE
ncbi:YrpD family protein [Paenibacillus lautus]|uniref:YrpD family protein n=1 Tax=Paenibacillus lautus TaxID=1401 RepID=UPI003D268F7F